MKVPELAPYCAHCSLICAIQIFAIVSIQVRRLRRSPTRRMQCSPVRFLQIGSVRQLPNHSLRWEEQHTDVLLTGLPVVRGVDILEPEVRRTPSPTFLPADVVLRYMLPRSLTPCRQSHFQRPPNDQTYAAIRPHHPNRLGPNISASPHDAGLLSPSPTASPSSSSRASCSIFAACTPLSTHHHPRSQQSASPTSTSPHK